MKTIDLIKALERLNKPFYTLSDLEKITGLTRTILYITLNRLTGKGILEKMAPGIYRVFTSPARIEKQPHPFTCRIIYLLNQRSHGMEF